jgi:alpha-beta hydrolase superfamily lysophospholipase
MTLPAQPAVTENWFEGRGGIRLFCRRAAPSGGARGTLICLHGLGDHSGLYPMVFDILVPRGLAVVAPDLRGHGRSSGQRGYIGAWAELRDDLGRLVARERRGGQPMFLLGNSLGGLIALEYVLHHPEGITGVIAVAPPLGPLAVPAPLLALGRVLSRVWPRFSLETGMDLSGLARDPAVVHHVLADPLFHRRGTARLSTEVTGAIARVQAGAAHFPVPALVLHGTDDRMAPPDGSRRFASAAGPRARLIEYPGGYHALLADVDGGEVLADLAAWLEARLASGRVEASAPPLDASGRPPGGKPGSEIEQRER